MDHDAFRPSDVPETPKKPRLWTTPFTEWIAHTRRENHPQSAPASVAVPLSPARRKLDRLLMILLGALSYIAFWMYEGCVNPLELFVDIPAFDAALYGRNTFLYYVLVLLFTSLLLKLLHLFIRGDEPRILSLEWPLMCMTGAGVGLASDSFARWTMDAVVIPNDDASSHKWFILAAYFALFFVLRDSYATTIAIEIVPFLFTFYTTLFPIGSPMHAPIVRQLVITFVLAFLMSMIDRLKFLDKLTDRCTGLFYSLPMVCIFLLALFFF